LKPPNKNAPEIVEFSPSTPRVCKGRNRPEIWKESTFRRNVNVHG